MTEFQQRIDRQTIDHYVEQAHAERADAFARAIRSVGGQIKTLFSAPETDVACATCGSNA